MRAYLGIAYVWCISVKDYQWSRWLIDTNGPEAELNRLARWLVEYAGSGALLYYKIALIGFFTVVAVLARHAYGRRRLANGLIATTAVIYTLLGVWWGLALWNAPVSHFTP